jgi:hypothetical protein
MCAAVMNLETEGYIYEGIAIFKLPVIN